MTEDQIYARRWWTLGALCFSLLIIGMDTTILNVALPTLARDLHAGTSSLQWIIDAYTLVYASMLLTTGSLGDRFGRKGALSLGLVIFGAGSLASAFSGSAEVLIACRAVMGLGGCLIMPATLSILTNVFPKDERAKAIGVWAGVAGLGIVAGPTLGGLLLAHFWWGSVFLINVPVVILALIAGHLVVPDSKDPSTPRLDPVGTGLSIVGLTLVLYAIIEAPTRGIGNPTVLGVFALGLVVVAMFALWELHTDHPMLDVRFFENPRFSAASLAVTLAFFSMTGVLFFLTQYLQSVLGYSALHAGLGFIPLAVTMMISSPASARLDARYGSKATVVAGLIIAAGAVALLSTARADSSYWLIGAVLALLGARIGLCHDAGHQLDHGIAASRQGRGGLGGQRHHPPDRRSPRRGDPREHHQLPSTARAFSRRPVSARCRPRPRATVRGGIGNVVVAANSLPTAARAQLVR